MYTIRTLTPDELDHYCQSLLQIQPYNQKPMANPKTIAAYRRYGLEYQWSLTVPSLYAWSDLHYGHTRIIEYANRPFDTVDTMNEQLRQGLTMMPNDAWLLYGGDLAFQTAGYQAIARGYQDIYLLGNHDLMHGQRHTFFREQPYVAVGVMIEKGNQRYSATHYPVVFEGCHTVHGHTHQHCFPGLYNMCVEHTNYQPRAWHQLTSGEDQ